MRFLSPRTGNGLSVVASAALALVFALPMLVRCSRQGGRWTCEPVVDLHSDTGDTRQFAMMWEVSRVSLRDFGELPSWNPYHCGGVVHYLDPQVVIGKRKLIPQRHKIVVISQECPQDVRELHDHLSRPCQKLQPRRPVSVVAVDQRDGLIHQRIRDGGVVPGPLRNFQGFLRPGHVIGIGQRGTVLDGGEA